MTRNVEELRIWKETLPHRRDGGRGELPGEGGGIQSLVCASAVWAARTKGAGTWATTANKVQLFITDDLCMEHCSEGYFVKNSTLKEMKRFKHEAAMKLRKRKVPPDIFLLFRMTDTNRTVLTNHRDINIVIQPKSGT